jgi:hypothetical protein
MRDQPMRRTSHSLRFAVAAVMLAATACSGDNGAINDSTTVPPSTSVNGITTEATNDSSTPASSSSPPSVASSAVTTSTTLLTVTTPPTAATTVVPAPIESVDWVGVVQGLLNLRDQLNAAPDPTRAGEVYAGGSLLASLEEQLANKQRDGVHDEGVDPTVVVSAEANKVFPLAGFGDAVEVTVVQQHPQNWGRVVDANGNVVYELVPDPLPSEPTVEVTYTMVFLPGPGQWLIALINGR